MTLSSLETIAPYVVPLITAFAAYYATARKYRNADKTASINEMVALNKANADFREEVRKDLSTAMNRIAVLEGIIDHKDKLIMSMQIELIDLRRELEMYKKGN